MRDIEYFCHNLNSIILFNWFLLQMEYIGFLYPVAPMSKLLELIPSASLQNLQIRSFYAIYHNLSTLFVQFLFPVSLLIIRIRHYHRCTNLSQINFSQFIFPINQILNQVLLFSSKWILWTCTHRHPQYNSCLPKPMCNLYYFDKCCHTLLNSIVVHNLGVM